MGWQDAPLANQPAWMSAPLATRPAGTVTGPNKDISKTFPKPGTPEAKLAAKQESNLQKSDVIKISLDKYGFWGKAFGAGAEFTSNVGADIEKRSRMSQEIKQSKEEGKIGPIRAGYQQAGKVGAGFLLDLSGEAISSAFKVLPDPVESEIKQKGEALANTPVGQAALDALQKGGEVWGDFKEKNPEIARDVESSANIIMLASMLKPKQAAKVAAKPVVAPVKGIKKVTEGIASRSADELDDAALKLKAVSQKLYDQADAAGVVINKNKGVNIYNKIKSAVGELDDEAHSGLIKRIETFKQKSKSGNMTLKQLDQERRLLSDLYMRNVDVVKGPNDLARLANKAIKTLDESIDDLAAIDIRGGNTQSIEVFNTARKEWARYRKFETVSNMVRQAGGDPNKIRSTFKRFVNKKKNLKGFSNQEVAMLRSIANPGKADALLKGLGRFGVEPGNVFLPLVGGFVATGVSSGGAGASLIAAGTVARQARKYAARAEPERLLKAIETRPIGALSKTQPLTGVLGK